MKPIFAISTVLFGSLPLALAVAISASPGSFSSRSVDEGALVAEPELVGEYPLPTALPNPLVSATPSKKSLRSTPRQIASTHPTKPLSVCSHWLDLDPATTPARRDQPADGRRVRLLCPKGTTANETFGNAPSPH